MVDDFIDSGGMRLSAHLARPQRAADPSTLCGLVLCHGFPGGPLGAAAAGQTYPQFADRLAADAGWFVLAFNFRGAGSSEGDFSLGGWLDDLRAAIDHMLGPVGAGGVWLAGSSAGGSLAVCAAGEDERVRGVATMAAPAAFDHWAADARGFLDHARQVGVVRSPDFPADPTAWVRELREVRPLSLAGKVAPRPFLVINGDHDEVVPLDDARALVDAGGDDAELRIINGAGHRLRHDPRAVAVLLGWMERQQL